MKNTFITALVLSIVLLSCSKEESLEAGGNAGGGGNTGGGGSSSGALLTKVVTALGPVSYSQDFFYDDKRRLSKYVISSATPGIGENATITITRDANGRVTRTLEEIPPSGFSDPVTNRIDFYYQDASSSKLKYSLGLMDDGGPMGYRDSAVFEYTGSLVTKLTHYYYDEFDNSYTLQYYTSFKYDGRGNIIEQRSYEPDGASFAEVENVISEFDSKPNCANFNDDAFYEQLLQDFLNTNNATKQSVTVSLDPLIVLSGTSTYEYRSDGKPSKSTALQNGIPSFVSTYTYK